MPLTMREHMRRCQDVPEKPLRRPIPGNPRDCPPLRGCDPPPMASRSGVMAPEDSITLRPIGHVESPLTDRAAAPRQGDEGAPDAWIVLDAGVLDGLHGIAVGDALLVLTWLDRAERDVLSVHPRGDRSRPPQGVFGTRSPDRPNPIGLHRVEVAQIAPGRLRVHHLEALDGTPVLDLKPVLSADVGER